MLPYLTLQALLALSISCFWSPFLELCFFLCREPTEEEKKRHQEIQEWGKRLKETYQRTSSYEDYKAWKNWCDQYNGGRRN